MIEIVKNLPLKCERCMMLDPTCASTSFRHDGVTTTVINVYCSNRELCDSLERILRGEMGDE